MIHVPASLMKKKRKNSKLSHRDIANIMHIQKNPDLLRKYRRTRLPPQRIRDDFITMYLVKWPLIELAKATSLIINLINHQSDTSWRESSFANMTPITFFENGILYTVSYKVYYNILYQQALERCRQADTSLYSGNEEAQQHQDHLTSLLRACFIIGFIHDERVRRFVMAHHSYHTDYTHTRPPDKERVSEFVKECGSHVNAYLSNSDEDESINILSMINLCVTCWIQMGII